MDTTSLLIKLSEALPEFEWTFDPEDRFLQYWVNGKLNGSPRISIMASAHESERYTVIYELIASTDSFTFSCRNPSLEVAIEKCAKMIFNGAMCNVFMDTKEDNARWLKSINESVKSDSV